MKEDMFVPSVVKDLNDKIICKYHSINLLVFGCLEYFLNRFSGIFIKQSSIDYFFILKVSKTFSEENLWTQEDCFTKYVTRSTVICLHVLFRIKQCQADDLHAIKSLFCLKGFYHCVIKANYLYCSISDIILIQRLNSIHSMTPCKHSWLCGY